MPMSLSRVLAHYNALSGSFMRLFLTQPDTNGDGGTEVSAADYVGKAFTFNTPSGLTLANNADIVFVESAGSAWGTVRFYKLMSTASGAGTVLHYGRVSPELSVAIGSRVAFRAGDVVLSHVTTF